MGNFDFLNDLTVKSVDEVKPSTPRTMVSEKPLEKGFRVFRNGKIQFSESLRSNMKDSWLDIVFSKEWVQYPEGKPAVAFLHINKVDKAPKADIKKEGTIVYIKERFLPLASELWGIDWTYTSSVDFLFSEEIVKVPIALLPKVVQRGDAKGKPDYVQREDCALIPFYPATDFVKIDDNSTEEGGTEDVAVEETATVAEEIPATDVAPEEVEDTSTDVDFGEPYTESL